MSLLQKATKDQKLKERKEEREKEGKKEEKKERKKEKRKKERKKAAAKTQFNRFEVFLPFGNKPSLF